MSQRTIRIVAIVLALICGGVVALGYNIEENSSNLTPRQVELGLF
ncbi:MAG TPA: hypothetical protein VFI24_25415 [Pyrinomonadaceae bacterium]|nr:hypothetical protein [Pyrinomonadaceae bacterium]